MSSTSSSEPSLARGLRPGRRWPRRLLAAFLALFVLPIAVASAAYWIEGRAPDWSATGRASTGMLPPAELHPAASIHVFAARTVRWRGIFATHTWIVVKEAGAARYDRFDYTAWGQPIRVNGFAADARWFGDAPEVVLSVTGEAAAEAIPRIRAAIAAYAWRNVGDYRAWPGPNSNTFVAAALSAAPELQALLPATAIGKDFPHDGRWLRPAIGGFGFQATLGGYAGVTVGWYEGVEINVLGAILGIDLRRPAIKLPAIGRLGMTD